MVTVKSRLGVTQGHWNGTIGQIANEFLFVFHCNYGRISYRLRNKARNWSKNAKFFIPLYL